MSKVLKLEKYKVYYKTFSGVVKAVDGVDLEIKRGEVVGVIGESGCGKSTMAQSLVLPKPPMFIVGGSAKLIETIELTEIDNRKRKEILLKHIALIPQYVMDALPAIKKIRTFLKDLANDKGIDHEKLIEMFTERLKLVNLPSKVLDMYPIELSGGMRQRVVIAISTLFNPDLLIADEPTSALDVVTQRYVLELFRDLVDQKIVGSLMFITHDIASIRQIADRIATMYAGKIVEVGSLETVLKSPLHPYTSMLIKSIPTIEQSYKISKLSGLAGTPPSLFNPPPGCRFHPRCPFAMDICRKEEPPLLEIEPGHFVACWLHTRR
ncbi:oligopeptide/dipeptide ABC transporter, ATPase subunit [Ignisphaera aggregans DSM 17230]|uniref:Oligopeptide/dipeptide ABC transporter, ATPase subunit n=1 Tax=Ignisphaera aggregans (strain DSM 17230 / JCM 13409 / AQ1.S1) TaxID=583356 RepID=E0ST00_IGNAA|nr:oligopeptide/dipeptide ABC transporter, ATPase subunit [Ignisphaera aggregans DSM 17230]